MKVNRNNQDLKIINWNSGYNCGSCVFKHQPGVYYCNLFCRPNKIWIKDTFNSDIFRV